MSIANAMFCIHGLIFPINLWLTRSQSNILGPLFVPAFYFLHFLQKESEFFFKRKKKNLIWTLQILCVKYKSIQFYDR